MRYDILQRHERSSERVRRHFLRNSVCGVAVALLLFLGTSANYGDTAAQVVWCALLALACVTVACSLVLPYRVYAWMVLILGLVVTYCAHLGLPFGYATAAAYIPFGLILSAQSRNWVSPALAFVFALSLPSAGMWLGWLEPHSSALPTWVAVLVIMTLSGILFSLQLDIARTNLSTALQDVIEDEMLIERERVALAEQRQRLLDADAAYRLEIAALTRQLLAEARLSDDLQRRQEDRQRLVQAIHHDLREPLRSIVSFTQLIRRRLSKELVEGGVGEYLAYAEDGGRRMARMLTDLVSYTSDGEVEASTVVGLNEVVREVETDLADMIARTEATITVGELPNLRGQRTQLVQLFQNLIANSLKFSRPGVPPRIEILAYTPESSDGVHVLVSDNGVGIPANQIEKVFGLFNRAHSEQGYEGSGVGLALCRRIAIAHGGDIRVMSVPAEGTSFTVALPGAALAPTRPKTVNQAPASVIPRLESFPA